MYKDFYKDKACLDHHGCSYTDYIIQIIDKLVDQIDQGDDEALIRLHQAEMGYCDHHTASFASDRSCNIINGYQVADTAENATSSTRGSTICGFNIASKTVGYLTLESTDFEFIGPDRLPVNINSIDSCLRVADVILSTNKPNYCEARIPIVSGLKVKAWETYLQGYPDNRLIQYIRFEFPLSIHKRSELHNTEINNHHSAVQYPHDTKKYIDKEIELGAMLGPVEVVKHPEFHCSPLMSHPKEGDTRRVILDLCPKGNSLNDHVSKDRFDGNLFALKLPSIDTFTQEIINTEDDPVLFKVDVARAFRNLPVDPADSLKFGLKVNNKFFWDKSVAFGWVHGTSSYQLISDAIAYIMKDQVNLHCYIDDYVAVLPRVKADKVFGNLCTLLHELGLPLNTAKLTPPH